MNPGNTEDRSFKKSVLLVTTFAAFLTPFLASAVNLALPSIGKDLHANAIGLGWVISSFILSSAIFLIAIWKAWGYYRKKKNLFPWYTCFLQFQLF